MKAFSRSFLILTSFVVLPIGAHAATDIKFSGFVKAAVIGSDRQVNSLGWNNLSAPTAAHPKDLTVAPGGGLANAAENDSGAVSFQTAQSRLNLSGDVDKVARAVVELDFFDASKSSPWTQQIPRVRIAKGEVRLSERLMLAMGQDWDVYAPVNTYTYNYTGNQFQAGNSGFMRQQAVLNQSLDNGEIRYAIGMAQSNASGYASSVVGDAEHSNYPTLAASYALGKANDRFGISAIVSRIVLTSPAGTQNQRTDRDVIGANLFAEKPLGNLAIRSELYYGQNLANTGTLSLSNGTLATSLREAGGFVSGKYALTEASSIFGTAGVAIVLNDQDMANLSPAVAYPQASALTGMKSNFAAKLGYDYKFSERVTMFGEASRFESNYVGLGNAASYVAEAGLFVQL